MFLLGRGERIVKQLNKDITAIAISVASKASTDASGAITQTQLTDLTIKKGGSLSDVAIAQNAKINLSAMQKSDVNAAMTSKMAADISSKIEQARPKIVELGNRRSRVDVQNIVERNVSKSFSSSALATLSLTISNEQKTRLFVDEGAHGTGISIAQSAEAVGKVANEMSTKIVDELVAGTKLENALRDQDDSSIVWIILLIALAVIGFLLYREYKARMRVGGAVMAAARRSVAAAAPLVATKAQAAAQAAAAVAVRSVPGYIERPAWDTGA